MLDHCREWSRFLWDSQFGHSRMAELLELEHSHKKLEHSRKGWKVRPFPNGRARPFANGRTFMGEPPDQKSLDQLEPSAARCDGGNAEKPFRRLPPSSLLPYRAFSPIGRSLPDRKLCNKLETIQWTCGRSNWTQLITGGNWLWRFALVVHFLDG